MKTLLTLPAELRNQIYHHVFTSRHHLTASISDPRVTFPTHALSLLQTCSQIHQEAALLAYNTTSFLTTFHRARALLSALKASSPPPILLRSISSLTIAAHRIPSLVYPRALSLFLENISQLADTLPALEEIVVLFERRGVGATTTTDFRFILENKLPHILSCLRDILPSARFELQRKWTGEPAAAGERSPRERGIYLLTLNKDGGERERRALRVEFLGCWPRRTDALSATEVEVEEALAADSTSGYDLMRRERPFLTAAVADPAERMGRHRRSLGSSGGESPGSSPRRERWGSGSPRSSIGFVSPLSSPLSSPRSSFGGEWLSSGRSSLGSSSPGGRGAAIGPPVARLVQNLVARRTMSSGNEVYGENID
ncbi:hypothetical protein BU16DRAFT_533923 [Lophium mytilinum]|uniref:F-box domain-containing protein n=1 Tax=Lophium mytilinum TaxID=390894 RepID=A0A6A6R8U2_9PEZI|nr:hypothetical protein BU16DRAFT_533923 [Lophium mytilinum]